MKYTLITASEIDLFEEQINVHLKNGWRLYGDVVIKHEDEGAWYYQAMVKGA